MIAPEISYSQQILKGSNKMMSIKLIYVKLSNLIKKIIYLVHEVVLEESGQAIHAE